MSERTPVTEGQLRNASIITGGSMAFVAVRCTIQYIILPFILPFFGLSNSLSVTLSAILELIALGAILYNVRRLWNTDWRWRYLGFSTLIALVILIFLYLDLRVLLAMPA
jgi:hypothetical protein